MVNESVEVGTSARRPARLRGFEARARHMHADKQGSSPATRGQRARLKLINVLAKGHLLGLCAHVFVRARYRVHVLPAHDNGGLRTWLLVFMMSVVPLNACNF